MTTTKLHHTAPYCTILHRLVASLIATHALSLVSGTSAGKVEAGCRVEGSLFRDNEGRGGSNLLNCAAPLHWDLVGLHSVTSSTVNLQTRQHKQILAHREDAGEEVRAVLPDPLRYVGADPVALPSVSERERERERARARAFTMDSCASC